MKTVFEGDILNVLSVENGLVIAYACKKEDDGVLNIAYKMVTFEDGKLTNVPGSLYYISKFGPAFGEIKQKIKVPLACKSVILQNGKVFSLEADGAATLFDTDGVTIWKGTLSYKGATPSGIAVNNRSVWVCYRESNVLIRLNLLTMKEELRIGGGEASPFKEPIDLFTDNDNIFVCTKEKSIIKVNLNTYVTEEYKTFEEPVLQYIKNGSYEFAVLQNGVYLID
ncbi:MAG: hypothetical protein KBS52_04090 [Clostridiales bacterium]|nr:hypothetical protein [Candidatus Equinaster intestinalis]